MRWRGLQGGETRNILNITRLYMTAKIVVYAPLLLCKKNSALVAFTIQVTSNSVFYLIVRFSLFTMRNFCCFVLLGLLNFFALCSLSANALHSPRTSRPGPYDRFFEKKRRKKLLLIVPPLYMHSFPCIKCFVSTYTYFILKLNAEVTRL